ncbi:MAG: hypothetical protein WD066_20395, partial [Planctomycetaceae bacterium]
AVRRRSWPSSVAVKFEFHRAGDRFAPFELHTRQSLRRCYRRACGSGRKYKKCCLKWNMPAGYGTPFACFGRSQRSPDARGDAAPP